MFLARKYRGGGRYARGSPAKAHLLRVVDSSESVNPISPRFSISMSLTIMCVKMLQSYTI